MKSEGIETFDFFIQMHLTERCNLACSHCYQEDLAPPEMSLKEIAAAVGKISRTIRAWSETYDVPFSPSFNVTGGEPLLRGDLEQILRVIADRGFAIFLLTNGMLVDERVSRMLATIPVKGVQVSLEGPEKVHDMIRGTGSFASAVRGTRYLLDAGITVTFNITLSDVNAAYFPEIISLAADTGVQRLGFSRLVPYGRGFSLIDRMLKPEKIRSLYEQILSYETPGLQIATGDPLASQLRSDGDDLSRTGSFPLGGCAAGISGVTVLPDGTLTPCRRLGIPIGNILKDSFRQVWANSDILNALRDKKAYKGKCSVCTRWAQCRGCRAIAYAYSLSQGRHDYLEEDPQCFIEAGYRL
ncbi:MAG: radical SAM protein [Syntrophorhabdaceae bacterium]|nr:radical SAM protein [Syntrophorhabdaceae bacterium]MDD4195385.1 radical SAM protein [Syntrophorhabdaceae bacterium]HOC45989.1 radical SAM protein [Syntrophorhabdaceae bacterium]